MRELEAFITSPLGWVALLFAVVIMLLGTFTLFDLMLHGWLAVWDYLARVRPRSREQQLQSLAAVGDIPAQQWLKAREEGLAAARIDQAMQERVNRRRRSFRVVNISEHRGGAA